MTRTIRIGKSLLADSERGDERQGKEGFAFDSPPYTFDWRPEVGLVVKLNKQEGRSAGR